MKYNLIWQGLFVNAPEYGKVNMYFYIIRRRLDKFVEKGRFVEQRP